MLLLVRAGVCCVMPPPGDDHHHHWGHVGAGRVGAGAGHAGAGHCCIVITLGLGGSCGHAAVIDAASGNWGGAGMSSHIL